MSDISNIFNKKIIKAASHSRPQAVANGFFVFTRRARNFNILLLIKKFYSGNCCKAAQISSIILVLGGCCQPPAPKVLPPVFLEEMQIVRSHEISMVTRKSGLLAIIPVDYYFETPIAQVKPNRIDSLEQMAHTIDDYLDIYPTAFIYVRGYTDAVYTKKDQIAFSQQYADMITSYLWNAGVPAEKIVSQGYGFVPNKAYVYPIQGKNLNRRVEIDVQIPVRRR